MTSTVPLADAKEEAMTDTEWKPWAERAHTALAQQTARAEALEHELCTLAAEKAAEWKRAFDGGRPRRAGGA